MRLFIVLVAFTVVFTSCASGPAGEGSADSHTLPPRGGRQQQPVAGDPVETKSTVKFADGSVDEYTVSTYDEGKAAQLNKQERFTASGQLLEEIDYSYYDEGRADAGLMSTKITKGDDNRIKSRVVYQYEGKNLVKESFVGRNGKLVSSYDYTYDNAGNMLTRVINNASGARLTETVYTYQNGVVVFSETKDSSGRPVSSAKNEYNADNNLVKQTIYNARGAVSRVIQAEWQDSRETRNTQLSPTGQIQLQVTNEYGPQGELARRTIDNVEGQSKQILEYEYAFQQQGSRSRSR
jgi:hypothetical protein